MTNEPAGTLKKARRVRKVDAVKEPDIDMGGKRVDVAECRVPYASRRMAIVQKLSNVASTVAHHAEPAMRDRPKLA